MEAGFELFLWIHSGDRSKSHSPNQSEWGPQPTQPILESWTQRIFFLGGILFKKWPNERHMRLRCERIPPNHMGVDPKIWENPPNHPIFNRSFHCKPSILGAHPYFWKHPYQVFLWTCSLSNNNGHLIQSTGPWTDVRVDPLLCRYLYLHAQHCRSGLHRNVRQVRTELPGQILLQCVFFANFFGAVSQIFHILASSPSDEQWPFSIVGWGENPNTFLPKLDDSWRTDWDWQGGGTTWNASLTSQWWGKGKEKKVHHQA